MRKKKQEILKYTNKNTNNHNDIFRATIHVIWILLMSVAITLLINEIFKGTRTGNIIGLILISLYVIFSFARKYQLEKSSRKTLEVADVSLTLLIGFFTMTISRVKADSVGLALKDMFTSTGSQPPMIIFYLGALLVVVGIIKVFIVNRNRIRYSEPKL